MKIQPGVVRVVLLLAACFMTSGVMAAADRKAGVLPPPPVTPRGDVMDSYFGTSVPDPYRWLEADLRNSDSVSHWVEEQDAFTRGILDGLPGRETVEARLTALWNYERTSVPRQAGGRHFFSHNDGLQNQSVVLVQEGADGTPRVLLDPNSMSADGTTALAGWVPSEDGRWLAWGVSVGGTDWQEWRVREVATGLDQPGVTEWMRYTSVSWQPDNSGYYYSRYDRPADGTAYIGRNLFHKVYFHRVGTDQAADRLVYERSDQSEWLLGADPTEDGRWLVMTASTGGPKNRLFVQDLQRPGADPVPVIDDWTAQYTVLGNDGSLFFVRTDDDAPRGRVVAIDLAAPERANWKTIVPEREESLRSASFAGDQIFLSYLKDASSEVRVVDRAGSPIRTMDLPGIGTAAGFGGLRTDTESFYTFSSFALPPTIYRIDLATGESRVWRKTQVDFDSDAYEVRREFITSKDGTRVPLFLAHRKGIRMDGFNPTLLYVYGGFNQPQVPSFSVSRAGWLEMGGVFALVCARGGGEYGREWHQAAVKVNKQKTFDDVIAAGEWLVANRWTTSHQMGLQGGSNGGMVVGAVVNQRPDLFGAVLAQAGVMDMLRYHHFTIGKAWSADYGLPDNEAEFRALLAYSPYHNVKPGISYPAILVTTADFDDRVVPAHSFKYAAALQSALAGRGGLAMIRISRSAGHSGGMKPTTQAIQETADSWTFLATYLGLEIIKESGDGE